MNALTRLLLIVLTHPHFKDDATILKEEAPSFLDPNEVEEEILLDDNVR